jgi:signal transduction histidine kinase
MRQKTTNDMQASESIATPGRILIVDDIPANLRLLTGMLKLEGFEVATADSGRQALDMVAKAPPDVILLDVMMPQMDGFEVCGHLKSNPETSYLPVVMVTALHESSDRVRALEAGADDFLTKPVDEVEVVARVRSLVRAKRDREQLEIAYRDLHRAESMRDSMTAMLVHDLRTPLTAMLVPLDVLQSNQTGTLNDLQREMLTICARSGRQLLSLVNDLLDVSKMESGTMQLQLEPVKVVTIVEAAIAQVSLQATNRQQNLDSNLPPNLPELLADDDLLVRVLVNLIGNAIKFTPSGGSICVSANPTDDGTAVSFAVQDTGEGVAAEDRERIFEKFAQAQGRPVNRRQSTGLGLTFCRLAVEAHGGRIWVDSASGEGSTFQFTVPLKPTAT